MPEGTIPEWGAGGGDDAAQFGKLVVVNDATFVAHGTDVFVRLRSRRPLNIEVDGEAAGIVNDPGIWTQTRVWNSLLGETHHVHLSFDGYFLFDSITVLDRTFENVFPLAAGAAIALGMALWVVASALRARRRLAADREA